ncbi:hypothetical protein TanjilG_25211 [Lupinus angustifolius]|uniref:PPC domain-containing protein n=1 Tax=Lupinus angustifolius TaxID=3871 RepID=A0A1J7GKR0_LUPAN|nr:PREDICTED: AT-hook motif nuclear-localized protein 22-like [Lupinus angustifolius]OIW01103.1 hypothetical protein TanjilG_25211 [Lupinus angustifolius]
MDHVVSQGHSLPSFLTRDLHLNPFHQFQPHHHNHNNDNTEEDNNKNNVDNFLNRGLNRDQNKNITTNTITSRVSAVSEDGREFSSTMSLGDNSEMGAIRRSRGRPTGSKNKPQPPIIINKDSANALRSHLIEISDGCDIMESVAAYARRRQRGVCILSASGAVTNVILRQPASAGAVVTLNGRYDILSLSGSFLPPPAPPAAASSLAIYLGGSQGQVVGGSVVGPLLASGSIVIMAASFGNASYERLPLEEEEETSPVHGGGGLGLGSSEIIGEQQHRNRNHNHNHNNYHQQQIEADHNTTSVYNGVSHNLLNSFELSSAEGGFWGGNGRSSF